MVVTSTRNAPEAFVLEQLVWVRSYNTRRAAAGVIRRVWPRVDGTPMASVHVPVGYFDWDGSKPGLLTHTAGTVIIVEQYRLEHMKS